MNHFQLDSSIGFMLVRRRPAPPGPMISNNSNDSVMNNVVPEVLNFMEVSFFGRGQMYRGKNTNQVTAFCSTW